MNIEDLIKTAIKMEEDGYDFYKKAEGCTKDNHGKMMYASLADDEVRHKALLVSLMNKVTPTAKELNIPMPKEKLVSVFKTTGPVCERVPSTSDDVQAITIAMSKETESFKMYAEAGKESPDPGVKAMFDRMAKEEEQHYEILEQTRYFLEQYANWSIWQEGGPIEGG